MIVTPDTSAEALRSFLLASIPIEPSELVVIKTGALSASECLAAGRGNTWKLQAQLTNKIKAVIDGEPAEQAFSMLCMRAALLVPMRSISSEKDDSI